MLPADLVVMAVGIKPNIAARRKPSASKPGAASSSTTRCAPPTPSIFAVGECVEHRGQTYGLVAPLWDMAKVCADALTGVAETAYAGSVTGTRLKVTGIDMYSAGDFAGGDGTEEVVFRDPARGVYRRLVHARRRADRRRALRRRARRRLVFRPDPQTAETLGAMRDTVIFGQDVAMAAAGADPAGRPRRHGRHARGLRLQRRLQGRHRRRHQGRRG